MSLKSVTQQFTIENVPKNYIGQNAYTHEKANEELYLNVEVEGDRDFGKKMSDIIYEHFQTHYFVDSDHSAEQRFEEVLKEINLSINELYKEDGKPHLSINAIIAVITEDMLLLTQSGAAEAYLIRKNKLNVISDNSQTVSETETFVSVAAGELIPGDSIILTTGRLLRFLSNSQIVSIYKGEHEEAIESVEDFAKANDTSSLGVISVVIKGSQSVQEISEARRGGSSYKDVILSKLKGAQDFCMAFCQGNKDTFTRRNILIAIIIIAVLIIVSVSFLGVKITEQRDLETYRVILKEIDDDVQRSMNFKMKGDLVTANSIIDKAEEKLTDVINANVFRSEAVLKSDQIKKTKEEINNIERISAPMILADLVDKRSSVDALGLLSFKNNIYVYDFNALYKTILSRVETPMTIHESEIVTTGTPMDDRGLLVFYTQNGSIMEYEDGNFSFADTQDEAWKKAVDLDVFRKNLYFLDPPNNNIWKYTRHNSIYSGASDYIKDENVDITDAVSFTIDGSIYVLKKSGEIIDLYAGKPREFNIKDLPDGVLAGATRIFTKADQKNLYVLDAENARVIVIEKSDSDYSPRYKKQYILENTGMLKDIYVEQTEQKMYILDSNKIYEVPLI